MKHTCATGGPSNCERCMQLEVELWDAINRYAIAVGGDPSRHVYGHDARMQAVTDVGKVVAMARSLPQQLAIAETIRDSARAESQRHLEENRTLRAALVAMTEARDETWTGSASQSGRAGILLHDSSAKLHPAYEAFRRQMQGRVYGEEKLNDAWTSFKQGWEGSRSQ